MHLKAEEWEEYRKRFPEMEKKKIFLSIDEYAYNGSGLKSALAYGMILNEMFRHTGFLKMAAYTMGVSTLDYNSSTAAYNSKGLLYKMYRDWFGTLPVAVSGDSPQPSPKYPPYGDQPKTSSGSPTYPLDMAAALTADHRYLTVAVVNATDAGQVFELNVRGALLAGQWRRWQMIGSSLDAENHVEQPAQVQVRESAIDDASRTLTAAPYSIGIYRFSLF